MVIHTTVTTLRLGCKVAWSAFPSMFRSWDGWRHRRSYLREMGFAIDVEGCTESWRGRVCPECQGKHIPLEGSVSRGVLWQWRVLILLTDIDGRKFHTCCNNWRWREGFWHENKPCCYERLVSLYLSIHVFCRSEINLLGSIYACNCLSIGILVYQISIKFVSSTCTYFLCEVWHPFFHLVTVVTMLPNDYHYEQ